MKFWKKYVPLQRFNNAMMQNPELQDVMNSMGIIGSDQKLMQALNAALQVAPFDVSVLVTGENGVGKEFFHRILHNNSRRKFKKSIAVNCGGLPEGTIDSELFGHVKGSFTGATTDRKGYFEEADGGTIFLDEIGELPLATQARLLRILETGEYYRVGSSEVRKTDVRIVAATNVDLQKAIEQKKFREDLYYRLSTITIHVPALRERQGDIIPLFKKFAYDTANRYHMPTIRLDEDAKKLLLAYNWPGNVRQLLHCVEEMSIVEPDRLITAATLQRHLPHFISGVSVGGGAASDGSSGFGPGEKEMVYKVLFEMKKQLEEVRQRLGMSTAPATAHHSPVLALPAETEPQAEEIEEALEVEAEDWTPYQSKNSNASQPVLETEGKPVTLEELEKQAIEAALRRNKGNKRKAADELGISERTIHRKILDYKLG